MIKLLKPGEYARIFGVSQQCVTRLCRNKQLKAVRVGSQWRIPFDRDELDDYAEQNKRTALVDQPRSEPA